MQKMNARLTAALLKAKPDDRLPVIVAAGDEGPPRGELLSRGLRQVITGFYMGRLTPEQLCELEALDCVTAIEFQRLNRTTME